LGTTSNNECAAAQKRLLNTPKETHHVMNKHQWIVGSLSAIAAGTILFAASIACGQTPEMRPIAARLPVADNAVASSPRQSAVPSTLSRPSSDGSTPSPNAKADEHPLAPVLRWAQQGLPAIEKLKDYSATLVRRERVRGKLSGYEYLFIKIRHQPFSVYGYFLAPAAEKGQEVIYIAGQNNGNLLAHKPHMAVTVAVNPEGMIAMTGRNYPLTEIGLVNLVRRLVEVGRQDMNYGDCEVTYFTGAKVNKRACTVIQVRHQTPRDVFRFHIARVFVDDELTVPIRYESYDWPREPGGPPELLEEYTYMDLKINNGFTDVDFSAQNPEYHFRQSTAAR
jgi:hypothetical protein